MEKLPDEWIDTIFMAMRATYGTAFDRQFECPPGEDIQRFYVNLKAWWRRDLAAAIRAPHTIRYALDHLPTKVPNLPEFKALCWQAPPMSGPALPWQSGPIPQNVADELAKLKVHQDASPKAWAGRLKDAQERGAKLSPAQREMLAEALKHGGAA